MSRPIDQWWSDGAEKGLERERTPNVGFKLKNPIQFLKSLEFNVYCIIG
jgi:hypothetical protein